MSEKKTKLGYKALLNQKQNLSVLVVVIVLRKQYAIQTYLCYNSA